MGIRWIPKATVGSANVTLGFGNALTITPGGSAAINLDPEFVSNFGAFDFNGSSGTSSVNDNGKDGDGLILSNNAGPATTFSGTFTNMALTFLNCANIPTIPNGCASVTLSGTTSGNTLTFDTASPNAIDASGLTPTTITTLDDSVVTGFSGTGALTITYANQSIDDANQISNYLATLAKAARATGVTAGTLNFSGGSNASIPAPIQSGSISGTAQIASTFDQLVLSVSGTSNATQFYFAPGPDAPTPPAGSENIISAIALGDATGDPATDAATLVLAINTAAIGWTAAAVGTAFTCTNPDTVYTPLFSGTFFAGFTESFGFSSGFSYTGN